MFCCSTVRAVVHLESVRKNPLTQTCSNDEVERVIKEWLRLAKDRDGGRVKRMKAAATATSDDDDIFATSQLGARDDESGSN